MLKQAIYLGGFSVFQINAEYQVRKVIPLVFIHIRAFFHYKGFQVEMFPNVLGQSLFEQISSVVFPADDIDEKFSVRGAFLFGHDLKISQRERFGKRDVDEYVGKRLEIRFSGEEYYHGTLGRARKKRIQPLITLIFICVLSC